MSNPKRSRLLVTLEGLPFVSQLSDRVRGGASQGILMGGILLLALGGALGYVNRGETGLLIGAASGLALGVLSGGVVGALLGMLLPPRQARAIVAIEPTGRGGAHYCPGDEVSGYVCVTPQNTFGATGGSIYLLCRAHYAHEKAHGDGDGPGELVRESFDLCLEQCDFMPVSKLRQGISTRYPFSFVLPNEALPTHHGYVCALHWTLHAVLDAPGEAPVRGQREILVDSIPPVLVSGPRGYQAIADQRHCQLTLILPSAVCAEGQRLQAQVRISPLETFVVDEVRALLLRIENTPDGDDHTVYVSEWDPESAQFHGERLPGGRGTTYVWLEDEVSLGRDVRFEIAQTQTYSLALDVPAQWRPTMVTPQGSVKWKLGVIVFASQFPEVRAFHEVIIHTGMPEMAPLLRPNTGPGALLD